MGRTIRFAVFAGGILFVVAVGGYALFSMIVGSRESSEVGTSVAAESQDAEGQVDPKKAEEIYRGFVQFWTGYRDALIARDLERAMALIDSSDHAFYATRRTANRKAIAQADSIKVFHSGGYYMDPVKIQGAIVVTTASLEVMDEFIYRLDPKTGKARRLVASADECLPGHSSLARLLMDLGQFEQARKEYKAILEQCQDQRDKMGAYWGLGKAWFVEKKYQEALVNFEKCLELAEEMRQKGRHLGSFPSYVYYVGLSHFHVGNRQEARRYLDRAMQLWKEAGSTSGEEFKHAEEVLRKIGR